MKYRYLLGDASPEARRLRAQAKLWDPVAHALFDRLHLRPGMKVLEVGPGQGSLHLELRRRVQGPVDAIEPSAAFAQRLRALCRRDGLGEGTVWETLLADAPLPRQRYDLIFVRWVFLFLPDPLGHLRKLTTALKPGGRLAVQDYFRETMALLPRPPEWAHFFAADLAFFASQGGDASVGARMPEYFRRVGLRVEDVLPHTKFGRPGSAVWDWLSTYFLGVMERYGKIPPFTRAEATRLKKAWLRAAREKTSVLVGPTVVDIVGRKPRRAARPRQRSP